jgi:hypothetical protein
MNALISIFLLIILGCSNIFSQNLNGVIKSVMDDTKRGKRPSQVNQLNDFMNKEPENTIKAVFPFLSDSSAEVRQLAVNLFGRTGAIISDRSLKQEIVYNLVIASSDPIYGIRVEAINKLKQFKKENFNDRSKDKILELINNRTVIDKDFIRIAGFVQPSGIEDVLRNMLGDSTLRKKEIRWAIRLALARTGDKEMAEFCVRLAERNGMSDAIIYELIPDLVYTRSHDAVEYMIKILNSDEKNCSSSNPDTNEKILCGYRIMEYLAPIIESYPLTTNASGDIKTDDYQKALLTVREWFAKQGGRYLIDNTSY